MDPLTDVIAQFLDDICTYLEEKVEALRWVDIEAGQIDAQEGEYPYQFPACWADASVEWTNTGVGVEHGEAMLNLRIALDIYDDTHTGSNTRRKALEQYSVLTDIHKAISLYGNTPHNRMTRVRTTPEQRADGYKVFNVVYKCDIRDTSAQLRSEAAPIKVKISPI